MTAQVFAGDKSELLPRSFEKSQSGDTPQTHCMIGLGLLSFGGVFIGNIFPETLLQTLGSFTEIQEEECDDEDVVEEMLRLISGELPAGGQWTCHRGLIELAGGTEETTELKGKKETGGKTLTTPGKEMLTENKQDGDATTAQQQSGVSPKLFSPFFEVRS